VNCVELRWLEIPLHTGVIVNVARSGLRRLSATKLCRSPLPRLQRPCQFSEVVWRLISQQFFSRLLKGVCMCVMCSLCLLFCRSHMRLPSTTLTIPSQSTHRSRVTWPVKALSYRRSGRTDNIHRCCYEFRRHSVYGGHLRSSNPLSCPGLTPRISLSNPSMPRTSWLLLLT